MSHLQKEEMENTPIHSQEKCKEADSGTVVIILFYFQAWSHDDIYKYHYVWQKKRIILAKAQ